MKRIKGFPSYERYSMIKEIGDYRLKRRLAMLIRRHGR
jgi:hypothetical protein